jgi:hypothetical protein
MSIKKLIILIAILIVAIAVLGSIALFALPRESGQINPIPTNKIEPLPQEPPNTNANQKPPLQAPKEFETIGLFKTDKTTAPSQEEADRALLQLLARNFLEDYGTFSTNGGYDHIKELYKKMTPSMQKFVQEWIESNPAAKRSPTYYGISTEIANITILSKNSEKAQIIADTMRTETDVPEYYNRRFKQEAEIDALKIDGEWKLDRVFWK